MQIVKWESLVVKKEGFKHALIGAQWHGETGDQLTKSRAPHRKHIWLSVVGSELEVGVKKHRS